MAAKHKSSGRGISVPAGIAVGVAISVAVMLVGALGLACLVMKEIIEIDRIRIFTMGILALSAALGSWIAMRFTNEKRLMVCSLCAAAVYLLLICITVVFFDSMFDKMGAAALMILIGAGVPFLLGMRKKSGKSRIKIPSYR